MNHEWLEQMIEHHREEERTRPVVVGVIADLSGDNQEQSELLPKVSHRRFRDVTYSTLETLINTIRPRLTTFVSNGSDDRESIAIDLSFTSMADFHPLVIIQRVPELAQLQMRLGNTDHPEQKRELMLKIQAQLNEILHAPGFKALEATWRGLHYLLTELPDGVRVRVLDLSKRELLKTLKKSQGFVWDLSPLFKRIYDEEFDTHGGQPFSLIIGDYSFSHQPDDCTILEEMAQIMAASHCIFMGAASPHLFGIQNPLQASRLRAPERLINAGDYARWRKLCGSSDATHLALVLPRILLRHPYRISSETGMAFHEEQGDIENLPWGNPAFSVGAHLVRAFALHRCYAGYKERLFDNIIHHLPTIGRPSGLGEARSSLEYKFTNRTREQLEALGFSVLTQTPDSGRVVCNGPQHLYNGSDLMGRGGIKLPYILLIDHLAHSLKSWRRHLIGAVHTPEAFMEAVNKRYDFEIDSAATTLQQQIESPFSGIDFSFDESVIGQIWDPDLCYAHIRFKAHDHRYNRIDA